MQRFIGVSTLAALVLTGGLAAATDYKLPKGFSSFQPDAGTGEVLISQQKNVKSARDALNGALDDLTPYFDGRPRVIGAVGADDDKQVEATFLAFRANTAYSGLAVVHVGARDALVGLAYDRAKQFADSRTKLTALLGANLSGGKGAEVKLKRTRLPDDSGAISLPDGWAVNAVNSMVDVGGPNGEEGHFGLWTPVYTRAGAAAAQQLGVDTGIMPVCDYTDPESAFKVVARAFAKAMGIDWKYKKRIDMAPAPGMVGKAAYLVYEAEVTTKDGKTAAVRSLVLIDMLPTAADQWVLYASSVSSSADTFDENLPTLLNIWKSWKTDDRVFQKRLDAAMDSMKATARILHDANADRQRVMDRVADDWSEVIRDTSQVRDERYGDLHEVSSDNLKEMIEKMNEHETYERWKIIPLKDINNP